MINPFYPHFHLWQSQTTAKWFSNCEGMQGRFDQEVVHFGWQRHSFRQRRIHSHSKKKRVKTRPCLVHAGNERVFLPSLRDNGV